MSQALTVITMRAATYRDIPAIAQIHVDTWRSTYAGIVPDEVLANLSYEQRSQSWHRVFDSAEETGGFTLLAENESGQIFGFADGGRERTGNLTYWGELNALYILKSQQQQGIGQKLVGQVARRLSQMEIHSMLTWVLEANPACDFYTALGGQKVQQKEIVIGSSKLTEVAYGWTDTSALSRLS